MNQFSLNLQPSDTLWYTPTQMEHQHQKPYPFFYNNNHTYSDNDSDNNSTTNNNNNNQQTHVEKEHMFEKPLTPSDVGKLNRLVIPKQHAEKYLPLAAATTTADTTTAAVGGGGGGLLLGFEDESGKCWRFRYSYWNSSQSYVLTKGWSRYVKEKKLDAGDVVLFERHRFEPDRFFIGWRRRGSNPPPVHLSSSWTARSNSSYNFNINNNNNHHHYNNINNNQQNVVHQISVFPNLPPESLHEGTVQVRQKLKKTGGGNSKRVRLFGVNLECQLEDEDEDIIVEDEPQTSDGSSLSSQGHAQGYGSGLTMGPTSYNHFEYVGYSPNHHNHNHNMDMNFPHDVNQQMRLG